MGAFFYYLITFAEAGLGVVGIRTFYEQPPYTVASRLPGGVELRNYPSRLAAETDDSRDGGAAFDRLFKYITGSNRADQRIAMTAPVSQRTPGARIAMTVPVQSTVTGGVMRFFLPAKLAETGAPVPTDPATRIVTVPAEQLAVRRFSGLPHPEPVAEQNAALLAAVARAGLHAQGAPFLLTYDAPFTLPFLRRNEVAVAIAAAPE